MEFIKPGTKINFMGFRKVTVSLSAAVILASLFAIFIKPGPNYGIDFAGGAEMDVEFTTPVTIGQVRDAVSSLPLGDLKVQEWIQFGDEGSHKFLIRMEELRLEGESDEEGVTGKSAQMVENKLKETFGEGSFTILKTDFVGPRVGEDLRNKGFLAIVYSMILILVYITLRFEFRYAVGAVLALIHDVIITTGIFVIMDKEFNLAIIAALLTIVGYSLNDTIVVFDRIRENVRRMRRVSFEEMINSSINETLSRTILTAFTTLITVFFLWLLGGGVIHDFALALLVGIIVGTYSSIFIASVFVVFWENIRAQKRSPIAVEKK